jgi:MFS family permease
VCPRRNTTLSQADFSIDQTPSERPSAEKSFRWNAFWFVADYLSFGVGAAFLNQSTVLPTFVSRVTDSSLLVGLVATVQSGAWLLPQLVAAGLVSGKARKRPYMMLAALIGRPSYLLLAVLTLVLADRSPTLLVAALFVAMALFYIADGFVSVPWFDILSRAIPSSRRGRLLGTGQIVTGIAGVAIGGVVGAILADPAIAFPLNYAALFALAGMFFLVDLGALAMIREPAPAAPESSAAPAPLLPRILPIIRGDRRLARIIAVRLAFGAGAMVFPFYVVFAAKVLGFGAEQVGLFLSAQVFGGILGGMLFGQIGDRFGTRATIRAAVPIAALAPALGLGAALAGPESGALLVYAMAAVFVAIGLTFSAYLLGFMNYVLELAPENEHATYAGLYNTIIGTLIVVPPFAGWLLEATSYTVVFAAALGLFAVAFVGSLTLAEPRHATRQVKERAE